jgi:hypothetical protein
VAAAMHAATAPTTMLAEAGLFGEEGADKQTRDDAHDE